MTTKLTEVSHREWKRNHPNYPYVYSYSGQMLKNQGSVVLFIGFLIGVYTGVML